MKLEIFISSVVVFIWILSAWEALLQLSRGKVRRILSKNKGFAEKVEEWIENRHSYTIVYRILAFCFLSIAVSSAILLYQDQSKNIAQNSTISLFVVLATLVLVTTADVIAKVLILYFETSILKITMPFIKALRFSIFYPFVMMIELIEDKFELWHQTHIDQEEDEKTTTEDEIMSWVEQDEESDGPSPLEEDEKRMIRGIFDLDDTLVREIMTPRVDVNGLDIESSISDAKKAFIETGHSRIPVYEDSIDEIKGIIFAKDFLDDDRIQGKKLDELCHKPLFIPEIKPISDLLDEIKLNRNHFAVVIDEYGGTSGIITFEDIIEEIVGEIKDEYDNDEEDEPEAVTMPDGSFILDARTLIDDVNELLEDSELPEDEDVDTIGGLVCGEFGRIPEGGEKITINDRIKIHVLKADKRKILTLKLKELPKQDDK